MFNERNYYQIKSDHQIFDNILKEKKKVGYYKLPFNEIESLIQYAESINKKNILVVGIGGSSLGSRAIYEFIKPSRNINKNLELLVKILALKTDKITQNSAEILKISNEEIKNFLEILRK